MDIDKELEDILNDPLLEMTEKERSLFEIPEDMKKVIEKKRSKADYVAQRKPCEDFYKYQPLFEKVHEELKKGVRSLVKLSKTESVEAGQYFIVDGQMVYLDRMEEKKWNKPNKRFDGRTRCVYENGTESDILLQTLRKNVMDNGYALTEPQEETRQKFFMESDIENTDKVTGYIYVLQSLSENPEIRGQKNLYKIGFSTTSVEERIANAINEPTYLMAPVKIIETYKIVNMNSHIFETILHRLFDAVNFKVNITDSKGRVHHPKEWFVVPLNILNRVVEKILDGTILEYIYNPQLECLEKIVAKKISHFDTRGMKILALNIKKVFFDQIIRGEKKIEYRELKQTTLNKYTYVDEADGKRYLRRYDALRLFVGYRKDRESALVQVLNTTCHDGVIEYYLGKVLEKFD